jgi:hypothetical protein
MAKYLIERTDGKSFDLPAEQYRKALRPLTIASRPTTGWGDHRIRTQGVDVAFKVEPKGITVFIEGKMHPKDEEQLVDGVLENIQLVTKQTGQVIPI